MRKKTLRINSVLGGQAPFNYAQKEGQFLASIAIDPEFRVASSVRRPGGSLMPKVNEKMSTSAIDARPMWIETSPKNNLIYFYLENGKFFSYSNTFSSLNETLIGTPTSGAGNGMKYYNNYIYLFTPTDVSRYGPLDGAPSLTNNVWSGATLGSQANLTNTSYYGYPNHAAHEHYGKLYFCDFLNGRGMIHYIQTTKTASEGDTNNGSLYNTVFQLPFGFYPIDIESYGSDLAILCTSQLNNSGLVRSGKAVLFLWDTFSTKPYRKIDLPDPAATAILTHNGVPYIWSGSILAQTVRLSRYIGGNQVEPVDYLLEGTLPSAAAVDDNGGRICWGAKLTYPTAAAGVYARGYNIPGVNPSALNFISRVSDTGNFPAVSAIKFCRDDSLGGPVIGWNTDTPSYGIDRDSAGAINSLWRSQVFNVGEPFQVDKIRIPLGAQVVANMSVAPKVYVDDETSNTTLDTINTTNDDGAFNVVRPCNILGKHNFFLELTFTGTVALPILTPIEIDIVLLND